MHPISFTPILKERPWGGTSLPQDRLGVEFSAGTLIGESWEITDRDEATSIVKQGEWAGRTIHELWATHRDLIFGSGYHSYDRFPLICKILDVQANLSIQVHPPRSVAQRYGDEEKNELWYIAGSQPDTILHAGFNRPVSEEILKEALATDRLETILQPYHLDQGYSVDIPAGLVHSICAGYRIYEIQQNSNTTYRLYDWGRRDAQGNTRELHQPQAIASILASQHSSVTPRPASPGVIADHPWFKVEEKILAPQSTLTREDSDHFAIVIIISGELVVAGGTTYASSDFVLVPAQNSPIIAGEQGARLLVVSVPVPTPI